MAQIDEVRRARAASRHELLARRNVVAVGVGRKVTGGTPTGNLAVVASVTCKVPEARLADRDLVPVQVAGVPTDVVATGPFFARQSRTDRIRPAPGGVSVGHVAVTAGTLGCLVRDAQSGELRILSNNHVLATSNDAEAVDAILQPAAAGDLSAGRGVPRRGPGPKRTRPAAP